MAYIVLAYIVMASVVMAYIVMARNRWLEGADFELNARNTFDMAGWRAAGKDTDNVADFGYNAPKNVFKDETEYRRLVAEHGERSLLRVTGGPRS